MPRTRSQKALAQDSAPPPTQKVSKKSKKITKKEVLTPNPALSQEKMKISFSSFVKERYTKFSNDYLKESKLGSGNFGEVIKVTQKSTSMKRAVKIIDKSKINKKDHEALLREIEVLKNMDHPNIVKIYEFYQDSKKLYIVMELCQGKELFEYLVEEETKFSEFDICNLLQQLFGAICYAHNKKIVHRDIKPENILIFKDEHDNFKLKVIDWGTAKLVQPNEKLNEKTGSMYYIAPEVLSGKYDEKCDVWSCGVILYMLITGQPPFGGDSQEEVFKNIKKGKFDIELPEFDAVSEDLKILLKLMLTIDCKKRPSALELINMPWLSKDLHQETSEMRNNVIEGLKKLKGFTAEMKLQQAVLTYIAGQIASKEENEKMKEAFMKLDKNKDGVLSREEILEGYSSILGEEEAVLETNRIFDTVDVDGSGEIDFTEFMAATMNKEKALNSDMLRNAFQIFDKDGNGKITVDELTEVLGNDHRMKGIIKEIDDNGDGEIDFEEFQNMMNKIL